MFTKIKTQFAKLFKSPQFWGCLSLLLIFIILPETTFANNPAPAATNAATGASTSGIINEVFGKLAAIFQIFMNFLAMMLWPVLLLIGGLLQNDIIFGGGMEERMRLVWIEVRNIINFVFVLALVGLAFYNALGVAEDKIKSMLPKIIIGIIAVNFTFLASKVVLDAANVVTVAVFALPQSISPDLANIQPSGDVAIKDFQAAVCKSIYPPAGADATYIDGVLNEKARQYAIKPSAAAADPCIKQASSAQIKALATTASTKSGTTKSGTSNPAPSQVTAQQKLFKGDSGLRKCVADSLICGGKDALAFNFGNVANLSNAKAGQGQKQDASFFKDKMEKLFSKYSVNNAALAMALNLQKVYDIKNVKIPGEFSKFTLNIIFSLVLFIIYAASYIALFAILVVRVLVIWMAVALSPLIIFSKYGINVPEVSDKIDQLVDAFIKHTIAPIVIGGTMTLGFIMLKAFQGVDHSSTNLVANSVLTFETALFNIPSSGMNTFKDLLIAMATCGVVWLGVFKTAEGTWAAGFTNMLGGALKDIGKFVLQSPQYLPLIPMGVDKSTGKEKRIPLAAALQGFRNLPSEFRGQAASDANNLTKGIYKFITGKGDQFNPAGKTLGSGSNKQEAMAIVQHKNVTGEGVKNPKQFAHALQHSAAFADIRKLLESKKNKAFYDRFLKKLNSSTTLANTDSDWQKFLRITKAQQYQVNPGSAPLVSPGGSTGAATTPSTPAATLTGMTGSKLARAQNLLSADDQTKLKQYQDILNKGTTQQKQQLQKDLANASSDASKLVQKLQNIETNAGVATYEGKLGTAGDSRDAAVKKMAAQLTSQQYSKDQIRKLISHDLQEYFQNDPQGLQTYLNQQLGT